MRTFLIVAWSLLWLTKASSQFSVTGTVTHMSDDNIDNNAYNLKDQISLLSLDAGYSWGESHVFDITYSGLFQYFTKYTDHSASLHQLSLSYFPSISDDESTELGITLGTSRRIGRESYTLYDNSLFFGETYLTQTWNDIVRTMISYTFNSVHFFNIDNFDFTEHSAKLQTSLFFPSRTTIILRGEFGLKSYEPLTYLVTDTITTTTPTPGQGNGNNPGSQTSTIIRTTRITGPSSTSSQVKIFARIAQGITTTTGIAGTFEYQWNIKKEERYFITDDGAVPDDELFDNPYGYDGPLWGGMITQVLPWTITVRLSYTQQQRTYSTLPAYDTNGTILSAHRSDHRYVSTVALEKEFKHLTLSATYDYINNASNDPLYSYKNHALTLSLSVTL